MMRISLILLLGQVHVCWVGVSSGCGGTAFPGVHRVISEQRHAPRLPELPRTAAQDASPGCGRREASQARAFIGDLSPNPSRAAVCGERLRSLMREGNKGTRLRLRGGASSHQSNLGSNGTAVGGRGWAGVTRGRGGGTSPVGGWGVAQVARGTVAGLPSWAGGVAGAGGREGRGSRDAWWSGTKRSAPLAPSPIGSRYEDVRGSSSGRFHKRGRPRDLIGRSHEREAHRRFSSDVQQERREDGGAQDEGREVEEGAEDEAEEEAEEKAENDDEWGGQGGEGSDDTARLRAMYEQAAREYPDFEYQKIKKEEEEKEKQERFLARTLLVLIAPGFSEMDVCVPVRVIRKALIDVCLVSVSSNTRLVGDSGIELRADTTLADLTQVHDFLGIMVPGGNTSYVEAVTHDRRVSAMIRDFYHREKLVCALGAGILALKAANVLYAHKVTAPPDIRPQLPAALLGPVTGRVQSIGPLSLHEVLGKDGWAGKRTHSI